MTLAILASMWAGMPIPQMFLVAAGAIYYWLKDSPRALLLLLVLSASTYYSIVPSWSVYGQSQDWTYGLLSCLCYLLLTTMPASVRWLKWAGIALSVHALLQVAGLDPYVPVLPHGKAIAWVGTYTNLAAMLALAAPASGPYLPVVLAGIWACGSRGALLAVAFAMGNNRVRWVLGVAMVAWSCCSPVPKDIARVEMIKIAWHGFKASPWLGNGPNTYETIFRNGKTKRLVDSVGPYYLQGHAHNDIAEALCSTGLLGLLAYLFFIWPLRDSASLMALFIFMKYNPVSFEVLCAAALVAANHLSMQGRRVTRHKQKSPLGSSTPSGAHSVVSNTASPA